MLIRAIKIQYLYLTCKSTVTPGTQFCVTKAYVVKLSTTVAVKPPCNPPTLFKFSGRTINSAWQWPTSPPVIWIYTKKKILELGMFVQCNETTYMFQNIIKSRGFSNEWINYFFQKPDNLLWWHSEFNFL